MGSRDEPAPSRRLRLERDVHRAPRKRSLAVCRGHFFPDTRAVGPTAVSGSRDEPDRVVRLALRRFLGWDHGALAARRRRPGDFHEHGAEPRLVADDALAGRAALSGTTETHVAHPSSLEAQLERIFTTWLAYGTDRDGPNEKLQRAAGILCVEPSDLRPKWLPAGDPRGGLDLLSFLKGAADASDDPLEVTVTGHSKGGALAPTVALWLKDALTSPDPNECWDARRRAQVLSYAFAGPTPGNEAFADRIDREIGSGHHHLRNMSDLVTHAWQLDELQQLPTLYGARSAPFGPLLPGILKTVQALGYRHAATGVVTFEGTLDPNRSLAAECIHQHLDAYLNHLHLLGPGMNAVTFLI